MRRRQRVEKFIDVYTLEDYPGAKTELLRGVVQEGIHVLVGPDMGHANARGELYYPVAKKRLAWWTNQWWCRLIRWLVGKGIPVPATWRGLSWAWEDYTEWYYSYLPDDVLGRACAQIAYFHEQGRAPVKVLVSRSALRELLRTVHGAIGPRPHFTTNTAITTVHGVPVEVSEWLADGGVIVC